MHVDNRAVAHGIAKRTIRGVSRQVLRRGFLLASVYDLEVEALWVPTKENAVDDALLQSEYNRIADLAPHLLHARCSLLQSGFLTYMNRDCHRWLPTTFGVGSPLQQDGPTTLGDPGFASSADWLGANT